MSTFRSLVILYEYNITNTFWKDLGGQYENINYPVNPSCQFYQVHEMDLFIVVMVELVVVK